MCTCVDVCVFHRAVLGVPLDMYDIATFDPGLGKQLHKLWTALIAARRNAMDVDTPAPAPPQPAPAPAPAAKGRGKRGASAKAAAAAAAAATVAPAAPARPAPPVVIDGVPIEDMCLTFTLPGMGQLTNRHKWQAGACRDVGTMGRQRIPHVAATPRSNFFMALAACTFAWFLCMWRFLSLHFHLIVCECVVCSCPTGYPEYELMPGGADMTVDSSNLAVWIDAVVDATLGSGITAQLDAFKAGFNEVGV